MVIKRNGVSIHPAEVRGASVDLHLGNDFLSLRSRWFGLARRPFDVGWEGIEGISRWYRAKKADPRRGITLKPGSVTLARTEEYVELPPKICAFITGRSSYARLGIEVQCTQDFIGPGRHKTIPLQLVNNAPFSIRLYPGIRICQLVMARLGEQPEVAYGVSPEDKYSNETDLRTTRFFLDPEIQERRAKQRKSSDSYRLGAAQAVMLLGATITGGGLTALLGSGPAIGGWVALVGGLSLVAVGMLLLRVVS